MRQRGFTHQKLICDPHEETYLSVQKFDFLFSIDSYRFKVDLQRGVTRITLSYFITKLLNFKVGRFLLLLGTFEPSQVEKSEARQYLQLAQYCDSCNGGVMTVLPVNTVPNICIVLAYY